MYGVVTEGLKSTQQIGKVYGMVHGIEGFLGGQYMDMDTDMTKDELSALKTTPGAFLGSCRFKMPKIEGHEDVYEAISSIAAVMIPWIR